uniref:Protein kinase domain-containing protein n=1 Tax=Haptolina brevifila TaxID=156173 RepID=A0A7S2DE95_9EUKA|mmetsp:Transcript_37092/g.74113  ORF Transcript_37092/g.74113 Transcript_37092/m.74113 type:complete len:291 (+) Transcript_37092:16-888(+)
MGQVKLTDYGRSREVTDAVPKLDAATNLAFHDPSTTSSTINTDGILSDPARLYMSPEILCRRNATLSADLWSFGVLLVRLESQHPPYGVRGGAEENVLSTLLNQIVAGQVSVCTAFDQRGKDDLRDKTRGDDVGGKRRSGGEASAVQSSLRRLALQCTTREPSKRPALATVMAELLKIETKVKASNSRPPNQERRLSVGVGHSGEGASEQSSLELKMPGLPSSGLREGSLALPMTPSAVPKLRASVGGDSFSHNPRRLSIAPELRRARTSNEIIADTVHRMDLHGARVRL